MGNKKQDKKIKQKRLNAHDLHAIEIIAARIFSGEISMAKKRRLA